MKIVTKKNVKAPTKTVSFEEQTNAFESEKQYRANKNWNFSALKDFDLKGVLQYHKKYILKEKEEEKNNSMYLGSLVDCLLLTPNFFDEKYFIYEESNVKGQEKTFVDNIYKIYCRNIDKELKNNFSDNFEEAFDMTRYNVNKELIAFKGKELSKVIDKFYDGPMQEYYDSLISNYGKIPVFQVDIAKAEAIVNNLKTHPNTADVCNLETQDSVEVINQLPIFFEIKGKKFKALLDKIIIDHDAKIIFPYDLKCTWEMLNFAFNRLKNRYYLQEAVYNLALQAEFPDFKIAPPRYILAHSANQLAPIIAETDEEMLRESINGFTTSSGKYYRGVYDLIDDLDWHYKNDIWDSTKKLVENDGILKLHKIGID